MIRPATMAIALVSLAACGSPPAQDQAASETALRDIGTQNDDAAVRAAMEQRARAKADSDIRDADRRDAARPPGE